MKSNSAILIICLFVYFLITAVPAVAQTMKNDFYRIQMGNLNSISGELSGSEYNLSITSGELSPGRYEGENYTVKAGFQYVPRSSPFSFSISDTKIDFGLLTPTNPVTRSTTLIVNSSSTQGYTVTSAQDHELMNPVNGAKIPDTTCDDGRCTQNLTSKWANVLTYGFGYRCEREKSTCVANDSSFAVKDYFKQFSDTSKDESASTVMSGGAGNNIKATILYKVNISSSQPAGKYSNAITFLATPNY